MKKSLLSVGAVLIVGLLLVAGVTTLLNRGDHSLCGKFIGYVRQNKAQESYDLYSANIKGRLTLEAWQQTVAKISKVYGIDGAITLVSTKQSTDITTTSESNYLLKAPNGEYNLTCFTTNQGKEFAVDGFNGSRK